MKYTCIVIRTAPEQLDDLTAGLSLLVDADLEIEDPRELELFEGDGTGFEWNYVDREVLEDPDASVRFYLQEGETLSPELEAFLEGRDWSAEEIDDSAWMNKLQGTYVTTRYGKNVISKPVWMEYEPQEGDIVIDIDPGMAFGTGGSPTTALALELLEKYMIPGARVMDVGCGTGILGILAAKMGASEVEAMDIDPLAVECTGVNIRLNGVEDRVRVSARDLVKGLDFRADLIAANLTVDILERLFAAFGDNCADPCTLIASGIIRDKERLGIEAAQRAGFRILEVLRSEEWVSFAAVREKEA